MVVRQPKGSMQTQIVELEITDETVAGDGAWALIEPVWNAGDIYGSVAKYEESLKPPHLTCNGLGVDARRQGSTANIGRTV